MKVEPRERTILAVHCDVLLRVAGEWKSWAVCVRSSRQNSVQAISLDTGAESGVLFFERQMAASASAVTS